MKTFKQWFRQRFSTEVNSNPLWGWGPYFFDLCAHPWCPRLATYDRMCGKHQDDPR